MIDIKVTTQFKWNGEKVWADLAKRIEKGALQAGVILKKEIKRRLTNRVGSIPVGAGLRRRIVHSRAGQAPFLQTGNLAASVILSFTPFKQNGNIMRVRVSSDVPYSRTLERGGSLNYPQRHKKWTSVRLVNPLKSTPHIAPRPAWLPALSDKQIEMIQAIKRG